MTDNIISRAWHRLTCHPDVPAVLDAVWTCMRCGTKFIGTTVDTTADGPIVEWHAVVPR